MDYVEYFDVTLTGEDHIYLDWVEREETVYQVEEFGLQIWCREGKIVTLYAGNDDENVN